VPDHCLTVSRPRSPNPHLHSKASKDLAVIPIHPVLPLLVSHESCLILPWSPSPVTGASVYLYIPYESHIIQTWLLSTR
jgi:hypothetical protein